VLAGTWMALAAVAAAVVAARHAHRLRLGPPGPAWLSLPINEPALARHLAWDSGLAAGWIAVPALGGWAASLGLVPWLGGLAVAPVLAWLLVLACRGGAALGQRLAIARVRSGLPHGLASVLSEAASPTGTRRLRPAHWRASAMTPALVAKDIRLTRRIGGVRRHLGTALLFWLLSALAWRLPSPPHMTDLDYVAAFVLSLMGSAA